MYPKSNNRFTLKIVFSYLVLGILVFLASILIYSEFKSYTISQTKEDHNLKLLKTNTLFAQLYEAENLSKLAIQNGKPKSLKAYARKVDSMAQTLDTLKLLTSNSAHVLKLDSIQKLLQQKVFNSSELQQLKVKDENSTPIDSILNAFDEMEIDMGRITPESFVPDFKQLPFETQNSIREYVLILNKNIPAESEGNRNAILLDSILQLSRSILNDAKAERLKMERTMVQKEHEIYRTDIQLSQKLRSIISGLERELTTNARLNNFNKQKVLKKSIRLAGITLLLGLFVVVSFTFLISRDFWKIQEYRGQLETEKKYSESLLKSREQLISRVSHDLKTPLGTIGGYTELMQHSNLNSKQQAYLKNVKSATAYVERLANDLLDFSKLEHGKIGIEKVPFVLLTLIQDTATGLKAISQKNNVHLNLEISKELHKPIISDPFRIRQVLSNLIGNAFKFTDEGHVQINAFLEEKAQSTFVKIEVIDTGIGIDPKDQQSIFEEFKQANNFHNKGLGGYGLGLTISKKLTELLEGTLSLESKKNKGSSFTFMFPCAFSPITTQRQSLDGHQSHKGRSLLIFDDDEALLGLLEEVCKTHSMTAHVFSCFTQFEKNKNIDYDIVLTDIQMPTVDGFTLIQKLKNKSDYGYKNQPILAMTGQKYVNMDTYIKAGFRYVLEKPFSNAQFHEALAFVSKPNIANTTSNKNPIPIPKNTSKKFSVDSIAAFLETPEVLHDILQTFVTDTKKNISLLFEAIKTNNYMEIRNVAHKMLPMFAQLNVHSVVPIIKKLEKIPENTPCEKDMADLKRTLPKLEQAIKAYMAKLPIDID